MSINFKKPIYRAKKDKVITGLIGGIAAYLGVNAVMLRLVYILVTAFTGFAAGIVAYIIGSLVVPVENKP